MDNSSEQDEETILAVDTEGQSKQKEENCRQEIEDIVRGFLIEKDVMAQSHEEEINRMKQRFDLERRQLLELLKIDRGQMVSASRISESATVLNAEGHFAAAPEVLISDAGRTQSLTEALMDEQNRLRNGSDRGLNGGYDMDEVDSSLIREIAEVYLRINNSALTSQMRPELDLEDKFEREKEVLERSFQLEKREMRRRLEEECHQKMEQERMKYEASIAELKATVSELQWQKREADNRIKHEKEKWEMTVEREKNDTEKRHAQFIHDVRRKLEDKHGGELEKQREKYEENISDLQSDISKLTMQLKELNESLNYEKEMIMNKFDREVKEMEQAFLEQRISLKETLEADFLVRLGHETSLLKAINSKLKEDLENTEKEKKVVERKGKEEKRKLEERFDDEITELEQRQSHEKRTLKTKLEERHQMELARQKGELEDTIQELSEEIALLKDENMQMGINFAERRDELQRRLDMEREGMQRKLENEMDTMRHRIEKELSDRLILEKVTQGDTIGQHKREVFMIQAKYDELQMQMAAMRKEREVLLRERENLLKQRNDGPISGEALDNSVRINDMLREKDNELANIKFENQQLEMTLSAVRREKGDLEDELANLRRLLPSDSSAEEFADIPRNNREMTPFQELFKRKEGELALLHKEKLDLANRLSTLERKNEQLEYEIANSTSKKLQVEDEISALKREKTDSENQVALLKRDKAELEELVTQLKKMRGELEDSMSTIKRANTELEHEISNLKRQNSTLEIEIHRQFEDQLENPRTVFHKHEHEHVTRENNSPGVTDERNGPRVMEIHSERQVASLFGDDKDINDSKLRWDTKEMQRMVTDLKKQKDALESDVKRLNTEKTDLENDLRIQLEDQRKLLQQERDVEESGKRDDNRVLKKQNDDLERKTGSLRKEQIELQDKVSQHKKDLSILSEKLNKSRDEQNRITQEIRTLKQDKYSLEKVVLKANRENGNAQKEHESPRNRTERDRVGNGADEEIYALRSEKDELQRELAKVKHQYMLIQKEISTRTIQDTEEPLKMKEEEISELQMIHAQLEKEILVFMTNKTQLEAEISTIQDYVRQEENELENLKRERMELELHITALQSRNTRLKAEGSVLKDQMHMDEIEVDRLRNEKADLEKDVFNLQIKMLQSENTALEVYGSAPKDEYQIFDNDEERTRTNEYMFTTQNNSGRLQAEENHSENEIRLMQDNYKRLDVESFYLGKEERGDDNDVDTALRVKDELEKDVLSLQSEKRRLETEISFAHNAWEAKKSEIASLQGNVQEITDQMESLTKQKKELQFEVMKIQTSKELEHAEFNELQRRKSDLEIQLTEISIENDNRGQNTKLDLTEPDNNDEERWSFTSDCKLSTEEQLGTIKQKLQLEIIRLQKPKNEEGDDLNLLQQQKTELEISTGDLQTKKHQMEKATLASEQCEVRRDWDQSCYYSDDEKQQFGNSGFSAVERKQEFNTSNSHDSVSREMYHTATSNFDSSMNYDYDSQVRGIQPSQEATTSTLLNSSESLDDVKDNNQMIALKREKSDLEGQIYDMMVRLTQLQTEVTELENKKTILEALRGTNSSDEMTTDMANAYEADPDFSTPGTIVEDKKDNLIREYEKQIRELKQTKIEMEQKIGLLEWQLENMKQKLDIQEICHRREISTLSEKTLSFNGFHGNNKQDDILQEFHQKLSYFLMSGEHSNKEIMEEIETQILKLQEKVHSDKKTAQDQFTSRTVKLEKDKPASASKTALARNYANQLKAQMETAENQLKSCEKVIHRLYGENTDLTKQGQSLEGKLKSASQSQEKLQRKKVHLQKLVEKLSNHMGKDAIQQSYFVFELDEDVSA